MSIGLPGQHRRTKNHKDLRSSKNKRSGKYEKQRIRTARNKAKRIAYELSKRRRKILLKVA